MRPLLALRPRHLRTKIVAGAVAIAGACVLWGVLVVVPLMEAEVREANALRARSIATMTAYSIAPALYFDDMAGVEEALALARRNPDLLYAVVEGTDGRVRTAFGQGAELRLAPGAREGGLLRQNATLVARGGSVGTLRLGFTLAHAEARARALRALVFALAFLLFGLLSAGAFGLATVLTRPLLHMTTVADRIADGEPDLRVRVGASDEVGRLSAAFNRMVDRLAHEQAALGSSEARFRAVVEHASDLVILTDDRLRLAYLSPSVEQVLGFPPAHYAGRPLIEFVHADDRRSMLAAFLTGRDRLAVVTAEMRVCHRDGSWRTLAFRGQRLGSDADVSGIVASARDVTLERAYEEGLVEAKERAEQARAQAEEMARLKSSFLANMSHEIRTPLTAVLGFAQILRAEMDDAPELHREFVGHIEEGGTRLMNTINSVLELARLEAGGVTEAPEPVAVAPRVHATVALLRPLAERKGLTLWIDEGGAGGDGASGDGAGSPDDARVAADAGALDRIVTNLVGNAIKFTDRGHVRVRVGTEGADVTLVVEDTGVGISDAFLPHLFDEFRQESSGESRSHEGTGLGLAITRRLVELMGGDVGVESVRGAGSRFTVRLPRLPEAAERSGPPLVLVPSRMAA